MELYNGRPEDTSGRKEKEIKVYDILDSLHIPYIRADHEAVMTMEACEEIDKALGMEICKNLFLCNRKKTSYYLLLMPGNKALKTCAGHCDRRCAGYSVQTLSERKLSGYNHQSHGLFRGVSGSGGNALQDTDG